MKPSDCVCGHREAAHAPGCHDGRWVPRYETPEWLPLPSSMVWAFCNCARFITREQLRLEEHRKYVAEVEATVPTASQGK